jgi:uroporphyrin-III C-methyltransferase
VGVAVNAGDVVHGAVRAGHAVPVAIVGAGAGDVSALTFGAAEEVERADVVFIDDLVDDSVRRRISPRAAVVDFVKRGGRVSASQQDITSQLIAAARDGQRVVRLKGGDPLLFGRGAEEAEALTAAGFEVVFYPGVSAAFMAASATGIPLTYRGVASQVSFVTAVLADGSLQSVDGLAGPGRTLVVYMGRGASAPLSAALLASGVDGALPVAVIENAGRSNQVVKIAAVGGLPDAVRALPGNGPVLLIVGDVVSKRVAPPSHPTNSESASDAHFAHG